MIKLESLLAREVGTEGEGGCVSSAPKYCLFYLASQISLVYLGKFPAYLQCVVLILLLVWHFFSLG